MIRLYWPRIPRYFSVPNRLDIAPTNVGAIDHIISSKTDRDLDTELVFNG